MCCTCCLCLWLTSTLFFLRRSPSPLHDDSMMQHLTDALLDTFETLSIPLGAAKGHGYE